MNDTKIDNLLRQAKIATSSDFTQKALSVINALQESESELDERIDNLLKSQKQTTSSDFTQRVINSISFNSRTSKLKRFSQIITTIGIAACIAISLTTLKIPKQYPISEQDFAQVSSLNSEISDIATLIYEQELIDVIYF